MIAGERTRALKTKGVGERERGGERKQEEVKWKKGVVKKVTVKSICPRVHFFVFFLSNVCVCMLLIEMNGGVREGGTVFIDEQGKR